MAPSDRGGCGPRLLVIYNPVAGWRKRRRLDAVLRQLRAAGARVTLRETTCVGDAEAIARTATRSDWDRLVVAGGDGTINEAVNGLADRGLPLALLPLGTANVLAQEIGLRGTAATVARAILEGTPRAVCLGAADGRRFTMMAGIGFDARVVADIDARAKRLLGKLAYVIASLVELMRYRPRLYDLTIDGRPHRAASAVIAKGHFYGGRFVCAREARLDEPRLHVCLFTRASRIDAARYMLALLLGRLHRLRDVIVVPAERVVIAGPAGEPVQGDGDIIARLPIALSVAEERLLLVYPKEG